MFKVGPTMRVSFSNEGKTQVGWVVTIGQKAQRWANINNTPPKGSPCHVPYSDEMTMKSPCLKVFENIMEMGMCKTDKKMRKVDPRC
jgi:hypothetical protein